MLKREVVVGPGSLREMRLSSYDLAQEAYSAFSRPNFGPGSDGLACGFCNIVSLVRTQNI